MSILRSRLHQHPCLRNRNPTRFSQHSRHFDRNRTHRHPCLRDRHHVTRVSQQLCEFDRTTRRFRKHRTVERSRAQSTRRQGTVNTPAGRFSNLRMLAYLVIHDSGWVFLEHLLLSWYTSHRQVGAHAVATMLPVSQFGQLRAGTPHCTHCTWYFEPSTAPGAQGHTHSYVSAMYAVL